MIILKTVLAIAMVFGIALLLLIGANMEYDRPARSNGVPPNYSPHESWEPATLARIK